MTKEEIYNRVEVLIKERQSDLVVTPTLRIKEDLNADSVDLMEFIIALEDEFQIDIPDPEADTLVTLQDVVDYVAGKLEG
ncbi:acyl carrier protein [Streptococcus massiliensis]|uniref:Acyl carrier protein n=1 Tax=Streptococcus massiliensis TaxID=313439 RepID=A0A380L0W2_9STRE|nr:acyl carrier protein [Streptococcus massiliensis]SUN76350.1 acyl carrier protein [Streptococcus massiliensis]